MRGQNKTPRLPRWAKAILIFTVGAVSFAGAVSDFTGFSLRQPPTSQEWSTLIGYAQTASGYLVAAVPLWVLPASWFGLWLIQYLGTMAWTHGAPTQPVPDAEAEERFAAVRQTADIFRDLAAAREAREKHVEKELIDAQAREERTREAFSQFKVTMNRERNEMGSAIQTNVAALSSAHTDVEKERLRTGLASHIFEANEEMAKRFEKRQKDIIINHINAISKSYITVRRDWMTFNNSFAAGSVGGQKPKDKDYVQCIIYHVGAMARDMEKALLDVRMLGVIPKAAWEACKGEARLDRAKYDSLVDEGIGMNRERKTIENLTNWAQEVRKVNQPPDEAKRNTADGQ